VLLPAARLTHDGVHEPDDVGNGGDYLFDRDDGLAAVRKAAAMHNFAQQQRLINIHPHCRTGLKVDITSQSQHVAS
jgi:hypothetical protein